MHGATMKHVFGVHSVSMVGIIHVFRSL